MNRPDPKRPTRQIWLHQVDTASDGMPTFRVWMVESGLKSDPSPGDAFTLYTLGQLFERPGLNLHLRNYDSGTGRIQNPPK